ncbi:MAG: ABC transporter substrate-binding protein [Geminicoccaceae bacterium]
MTHQTFWPSGLWASAQSNPYSLDVEKAKALLVEAGKGDGFNIEIDSLNTSPYMEIAQSLQQTLGEAGITAEIMLLRTGSALWPKYRARRHGLILARWSPDYVDPHSNADSFAHNPDNSEEAQLTSVLAWRNAGRPGDHRPCRRRPFRKPTSKSAAGCTRNSSSPIRPTSPFAIMFQQNEQVARRNNVEGFVSGSNFDLVFYRNVTKQ